MNTTDKHNTFKAYDNLLKDTLRDSATAIGRLSGYIYSMYAENQSLDRLLVKLMLETENYSLTLNPSDIKDFHQYELIPNFDESTETFTMTLKFPENNEEDV